MKDSGWRDGRTVSGSWNWGGGMAKKKGWCLIDTSPSSYWNQRLSAFFTMDAYNITLKGGIDAISQFHTQRGNVDEPIRNSSIERAAWRPSRMAQTTSDWPRRMSPAANTLSTLVV